MPTTCRTGPRAGRPTSGTWSSCATATTACCTRGGGRRAGPRRAAFGSTIPPAGRSAQWRSRESPQDVRGLRHRVVPLRELEDVPLRIPEVAPRVRVWRATLDLRDDLDPTLDELPTRLPDVLDGEPHLIAPRLILRRRVAPDELEQSAARDLEMDPIPRAAGLPEAQRVPIEAMLRLEVITHHADPRRPPERAVVHLHLQADRPLAPA